MKFIDDIDPITLNANLLTLNEYNTNNFRYDLDVSVSNTQRQFG